MRNVPWWRRTHSSATTISRTPNKVAATPTQSSSRLPRAVDHSTTYQSLALPAARSMRRNMAG